MSSVQQHVFVVEDDPEMRSMVSDFLAKQSLQITAMSSAEEMLKRINTNRPDLIVLDVSLPGVSGLQACQTLRAQGDRIPIILLTARTEEIDRVLGLEMGADDYLGKPFSARELLARIRAVLRRTSMLPGSTMLNVANIQFGKVQFDTQARRVKMDDGSQVALSTIEYAMLSELVGNPHVPISRERLLAVSHGTGNNLLPRTADVALMRLRKMLEPDPANPRYLQTVRGQGYMFVPDTE